VTTQRLGVLTACVLAAAIALGGCARTTPRAAAGADAGAGGAAAPVESRAAASPAVSAATGDAKAALLASVKHMDDTIYRFTGGQNDVTSKGHADPVHKSASLAARGTSQGVAFSQEFIAIGSDYWVRLNMGGAANKSLGVNPAKWMHVDARKLGNTASLPFDLTDGDVLNIAGLLGAVSEAQQTGPSEYSGIVDMTAAAGISAMTQENLDKLGAGASALPFTATLDAKGRLTDFIVDAAGVNKALGARFTFSDFGVKFPITKPRNTVEAPASVYNLFKN
jgi:hypothetical protein